MVRPAHKREVATCLKGSGYLMSLGASGRKPLLGRVARNLSVQGAPPSLFEQQVVICVFQPREIFFSTSFSARFFATTFNLQPMESLN